MRRPIKLPVIRSARGKIAAATGTALISSLMYFVPQYLHRGYPVLLPMTAVDMWVPFWPVSGLVYFAVFPLLLGTFVAIRDLNRATRFLYACLFAQTIGMACFLLWPTRYPRELFALPPTAGAIGAALVTFCRSTDVPVNCLPSLHVSTVVLCVGALQGSRLFVPAMLIGVPLIASTLTFKQHYFADVVAGLVLGLLAWLLFLRHGAIRAPQRAGRALNRPSPPER